MKTLNSNKLTDSIPDTSLRKTVKIAGFMFLFAFIVPTLNWVLVLSKFIVAGDALATATNINSNGLMFRTGITIELIMSVGLVILAVTLYLILKSINKNLALLALSLKLIEAAIAVVITLVSFIALLVISNDAAYLSAIGKEPLQAFAGFIIQKHTVLYSIPMVFLGLDMILFSYLFCKSKYIPKALARFGVISFALIFIHALMYILAPEFAAMPINQAIFWAPSGIFEIIIGIWLLVKGIKIPLTEVDN